MEITNIVTDAPKKVDRQTLYSLQVMRGIAAFAVAIYHTHIILAKPVYGGKILFAPVASLGWSGVNFFFILSGFIIVYAHNGDIGRPDKATHYIWRRFSRVYPIYWVLLGVYVAASWVGIGHPDFGWSPVNLLSSFLLIRLNSDLTLPLQVAWTLFYEIMFYAAFLTLILNRWLGIGIFALWISAIIYFSLIKGDGEPGWHLHVWNFYFVAGAVTYFLFKKLPNQWDIWIFVAGIGMLLVCALTDILGPRLDDVQRIPWKLMVLILPFAMILLGGVLLERHRDWKAPDLLLLLGNASYAIYLVHSPVISVLAQINARLLGDSLPDSILFLAILILSVSAGVVAHLILEKPTLALLQKYWNARQRARVAKNTAVQ